jgi:hypothetical protein
MYRGSQPLFTGALMILAVNVSINELLEKGRDFPWPKPRRCGRCGGVRLWGHGFVSTYFDGASAPVWQRRYRCPDCRCMHRMRPFGYFTRFQALVQTIWFCLTHRLHCGRWPPGFSRSRQGHWLRSLKKKAIAYFGLKDSAHHLLQAFDRILKIERIPVSRSFNAVFRPYETYPTQECR